MCEINDENGKPLVKIIAMAKIPQCPHCGKFCSPCGGTLDGKEMYWTCWDCKYEIQDIEATEIKPLKLNT